MVGAGVWLVLSGGTPATAADHLDAPALVRDAALDLGDLYLWRPAPDRLAIVLTVAPGLEAGAQPPYDPSVLYGVHFDEDGDSSPDRSLWIQFGTDPDTGDVGVRARGVPGGGTMVGPVETVLTSRSGGARLWAGLRDDPFFYDAEGFDLSVATQTFAFDPRRDAFAGTNAIAIALDVDSALLGADEVRVWATAGRAR